LQTQNSNQLN